MSKRSHRRRRLAAVSHALTAEKNGAQKTPLKNGENGKNGLVLSPAPEPAPAPHKDSRGRFTKGNPGGPGRPRKPAATEYHNATVRAVALDAWEQVVARALEDAQAGDKHARRWLGDYVLGHPVTPSAVDGIPTPMLERLIALLRATGHEPEQVFENLILRLEQEKTA